MLYILRHGQTSWNLEDKLQGQTDTILNENGRNSARLANQRYQDVHLDICYVSPLNRAFETAKLVLEGRNIPIIMDDRLKEMCFGGYEGSKNHPEDPNHPVNLFYHDPTNYKPDDKGESFEELYERTNDFIQNVLLDKLKEGKDILIVGHGAMNLSIINQLYDVPLSHYWDYFMGNCEMVTIDITKIKQLNNSIKHV